MDILIRGRTDQDKANFIRDALIEIIDSLDGIEDKEEFWEEYNTCMDIFMSYFPELQEIDKMVRGDRNYEFIKNVK